MEEPYDLERHIAQAAETPTAIDVHLLDRLGCAALFIERGGARPMPYYAQDIRAAVAFIREHLDRP